MNTFPRQAPNVGDVVLTHVKLRTHEYDQSFVVAWVESARDGNGWYVGMNPTRRPDSMKAQFGATNLRQEPKKFGVTSWKVI